MPAGRSSHFPVFVQTRASVGWFLGGSKSLHHIFRTANVGAFFGGGPLPLAPLALFFRSARNGARFVGRARVVPFALPGHAKGLSYAFLPARVVAGVLLFPFAHAPFALALGTGAGARGPGFGLACLSCTDRLDGNFERVGTVPVATFAVAFPMDPFSHALLAGLLWTFLCPRGPVVGGARFPPVPGSGNRVRFRNKRRFAAPARMRRGPLAFAVYAIGVVALGLSSSSVFVLARSVVRGALDNLIRFQMFFWTACFFARRFQPSTLAFFAGRLAGTNLFPSGSIGNLAR